MIVIIHKGKEEIAELRELEGYALDFILRGVATHVYYVRDHFLEQPYFSD